jgi:hypothetical protein
MPIASITWTRDTTEEVDRLLEIDRCCRWITFLSNLVDNRAAAMNVHSYARKKERNKERKKMRRTPIVIASERKTKDGFTSINGSLDSGSTG